MRGRFEWRRLVGSVLIGLSGIMMTATVMASPTDSSPPPTTDQIDQLLAQQNVHPALEKLGRGLSNVAAGWLEVPQTIHQRYNTTDVAASMFDGCVIGLVRGVLRTGIGVYEAATFWLPYPADFAPILPPLAYFNHSDPFRKPLPLE